MLADIDVAKLDPEGDCPVYTAMSGQDKWTPTLAASTFAQFLRILSTAMEIASGFGDAIMDDEDEDSYREALGPKVKIIDAAGFKLNFGHTPSVIASPIGAVFKTAFSLCRS